MILAATPRPGADPDRITAARGLLDIVLVVSAAAAAVVVD